MIVWTTSYTVRVSASPGLFPFLLLLPLLSAHLLWAAYKSLSQEECQSVRCQSEPRLPFHLSCLPMTEERGKEEEEEGAQLHYQHTHTFTGYITLWKQWEVGPRRYSSLSSDCFMTSAFIPPHPSGFGDVSWSMKAAHYVARCPV